MSRWAVRWKAGGIPVEVRPGFWLFTALLFAAGLLTSWQFAAWLVAGTAALNVLHEFGHAVTARAFGAEVSISLDAVAGRTHYVPIRSLSAAQHTAIVLAGPVTHIALGLVAVLASGANPFDTASVQQRWASEALWWAGPVLGAMNLLPIVPLDGGMVLATVIDRWKPGRGIAAARIVGVAIFSVLAVVLAALGSTVGAAAAAVAALVAIGMALVSNRPVPAVTQSSTQTIFLESLVNSGQYTQAALLGRRAFEVTGEPAIAVLMARCAASSGDPSAASAWLGVARRNGGDAEVDAALAEGGSLANLPSTSE